MLLKKIKLIKLKVIKNTKGDLLKYLNKKDKFFRKFGEIYFNEIKKNQVKGWNYHKKYWCLITVPSGKVKFTFAENIRKKKKVITIGRKNSSLIVVPPKIWFNFRSIAKISLVVNTLDEIHSKNETLKAPLE
tara:strand:- start:150 stop:545 length:396 start_codon:yes stop_codon:yes gene_type:complete